MIFTPTKKVADCIAGYGVSVVERTKDRSGDRGGQVMLVKNQNGCVVISVNQID
jgi:hypothetical protein